VSGVCRTVIPVIGSLPVVPGLTGLAILARGGHATVFRAVQESIGRDVAVKIENRTLEDDRDRRRFLREARAAGRMSSHPHVVDLFDAGVTAGGYPYLIMELCEASFADRVRKDPLSPEAARDVGVKIADALADAHSLGVMHRDVKPANILISRFGEPALADFGLAVLVETRETSITLDVLTPAYAPPEMFRHGPPEPSGDVYSLCATVYALMSGRPPRWPAGYDPSLVSLMDLFTVPVPDLPGVPPDLMAVLRAGMANDPGSRPSAGQLRDVLTGLRLDGSAIAAAQLARLAGPGVAGRSGGPGAPGRPAGPGAPGGLAGPGAPGGLAGPGGSGAPGGARPAGSGPGGSGPGRSGPPSEWPAASGGRESAGRLGGPAGHGVQGGQGVQGAPNGPGGLVGSGGPGGSVGPGGRPAGGGVPPSWSAGSGANHPTVRQPGPGPARPDEPRIGLSRPAPPRPIAPPPGGTSRYPGGPAPPTGYPRPPAMHPRSGQSGAVPSPGTHPPGTIHPGGPVPRGNLGHPSSVGRPGGAGHSRGPGGLGGPGGPGGPGSPDGPGHLGGAVPSGGPGRPGGRVRSDSGVRSGSGAPPGGPAHQGRPRPSSPRSASRGGGSRRRYWLIAVVVILAVILTMSVLW